MNVVDMQASGIGDKEGVRALETGNILLFPQTPFPIPEQDRLALLNAGQADGNFHKNIAYKPGKDQISGVGKTQPGEGEKIASALRNYSRNAIAFLEHVLAPYRDEWRVDYASFRSLEEEGRDLPWKKRNDLLHTDAFPTRPTNGDLILRIFTNINPTNERVWVTSDPFERVATQYAEAAGLQRIAGEAASPGSHMLQGIKRMAHAAGLPVVARSPYDEFMLGFHDFLKANAEYQNHTPKYRFAFPPGATWIVFTDVVPHSVLSGRYALEQTMIISRKSLLQPECAPVAILEKLSGTRLTE